MLLLPQKPEHLQHRGGGALPFPRNCGAEKFRGDPIVDPCPQNLDQRSKM